MSLTLTSFLAMHNSTCVPHFQTTTALRNAIIFQVVILTNFGALTMISRMVKYNLESDQL